MFFPEDEDDLAFFMKNRPYNLPTFIIGAGSNLLVRDGGIPGVVIKLDNKNFKKMSVEENTLTLGAGFRNVTLEKSLIEKGIGGLEFLCSIPGVIGGSVKTNAGCYGKEVKDVIVKATIVNGMGEKKTISVDDLKLSYRSSLFPDDWIVTSITFKTYPENPETETDPVSGLPYIMKHAQLSKKAARARANYFLPDQVYEYRSDASESHNLFGKDPARDKSLQDLMARELMKYSGRPFGEFNQ